MSLWAVSANVILLFSAGLGSWWFIGRKAPLYFQILTLAVLCYATVALYRSVYYFCYGAFYQEPGITLLGFFGCFLFLFSANFGQFDSFIDDRSEAFLKYRLIALIAPAVLLLSAVLFALTAKGRIPTAALVLTLIGFVPAIPASYYDLKHLIMPDMGFSFTEGVRLCNLFALLIEMLEAVRLFASVSGSQAVKDICLLCISAAFLGLTLFARRGRKLWSL